MSGKRNKQRRREEREIFKELDEFFGPVKEEVLEDLDGDVDDFVSWLNDALRLHRLFPEIPVEDLTPQHMGETVIALKKMLDETRADFERSLQK